MIEKGQCFGITSTLLITEVLTKPLKENDENLLVLYETFIKAFPNLLVKSVDFRVARLAATIRAKYGLKTPDAVFLASAIEEKAQVFITNDIELKKISEINFIVLDETI